ncbi:MAG TPA: DUF547 domain-containing protein [Chthoniobacterales bacterium]|nr:DUF547 domain-containing protein [Chthoniobacterales bacterium]
MKIPLRVLLAAAFCVVGAATSQAQSWMEPYNRLLGKYVTSGGVKYAEWKNNAADMQALQAVVDGIAKESISGLDKRQQVAFYCNAYNAWILHEALGKYPTASVKDTLFTFFTSKRITIAGQKTSFKALEDNVIRKLGEPRIHFALNCASRSCPPLNREAFSGPKLDGQLEKLAKGYVNSDRGVRYSAESKTAQLSKIFDWYKDDFASVGGPVAFINKRRATPMPSDTKITYQEYDWGLNEVK